MLASVVASCAASCLLLYAAMAVGHSFNRHKKALSVVFAFVFYHVVQILLLIGAFAVAQSSFNLDHYFDSLNVQNATAVIGVMNVFFAVILAVQAALCLVFYFITHYSLTKKLNLHHLRYKRGYKNVIDMGVQLNADGEVCELAIETSGHGAFRENHFSDDGAYIAVKIICQMALLRKEGRRIEDLIADLKQPAESEEIRYHIGREDFRLAGENVLNDFRAFCKADPRFHLVVPNFEGIRVSFDDEEVKGWLLLRMSLHDPVLPLNLESKEAGGTAVIRQRIAPFFEQYDWLS